MRDDTAATRRAFLGASALGLASTLAAPVLLPGCAPDPATSLRGVQPRDELIAWLADPDSRGLAEGVLDAFARGLSERELMASLFMAGLRRFTHRDPAGDGMHMVYAVHAAHELSLRSPPAERLDLVLWASERFESARENEGEPTRVLPAAEDLDLPPAAEAEGAYVDAMEGWDEEGADRAALALHRADPARFWLRSLVFSARNLGYAWHHGIFGRHAVGMLPLLRPQDADVLARSFTAQMLRPEDLQTDDWERNVVLADQATAPASSVYDEDAVRALEEALRTDTAPQVCERIVGLLADGMPEAAAWDAVALHGVAVLLRGNGGGGRHATTFTAALRVTASWLPDPRDRVLLLLQAASVAEGTELDATRPDERLFAIESRSVASLDEVFRDTPEEHYPSMGSRGWDAVASAAGWLEAGGLPEDLFDTWRRLLASRVQVDAHFHKFLLAVDEQAARLPPGLRTPFLAASMLHAPSIGWTSRASFAGQRRGIAALYAAAFEE